MTGNPRVIYVTHHLPWPARSGGRLREVEILRRLASDFDIEVVAVSKVPESDLAAVQEAERCGVQARVFAAETGSRLGGPLVRRHGSAAAKKYLASALESGTAVVHVEGHYLLPLLPAAVRPNTVLVEHNVESQLFLQRALGRGISWTSLRMCLDALLTRRTERRAWGSVSLVGAVTADDAAVMRAAAAPHVEVLPNGCDHLVRSAVPGERTRQGPPPSDLLYVGNFAYQPNQDAALWLLSEIFPKVTERAPDATLSVVGPNPPEWLREAAQSDPRVHVPGFVPDLAPWMETAKVVVCPLRVGGGIKVKVLEALACGKAIVTTSVGRQGLGHLPTDSMVQCDDADSIAGKCVHLLESPAERQLQEKRAQAAAKLLPTWDDAAEHVKSTWSRMLAPNKFAVESA